MGPHTSKPRNVNIASVFYKAGFIESWGRGILKIQKGFEEAGIKAPQFEEDCGGVRVTMFRNTETSTKENNQGETKEKKQGETKEKIIELIRNNPYITQKEMRELLGLSQSGIEYQIKNLKQDGVIKRVGGDRGGHWEVVK